jgi:Txe/YoeB family toxin of toxin-antitoxin system
MAFTVFYTRQAEQDWATLQRQGNASLVANARSLLDLLASDPFAPYPPYKKLKGELAGLYARRINLHHRLVYQVLSEEKAVKVVSLWTHYGD